MNLRKPNRLINQKSLYLQQHAYNPIDWYPWCEEAFEKAVREDKPVFLSIGYSACHWCHVMERESFEDEEIAKILNENFVSIKVDKEENPDVDNYYMTYVNAISGSGGWPLNVFLLPDKTPFYGGTYFPPVPRYGRNSFKEILLGIIDVYRNRKDDLLQVKSQVGKLFYHQFLKEPVDQELNEKLISEAYRKISSSYDWKNGGWGNGAKFPMFQLLNFLIDYFIVYREEEALKIVRHNVLKMLTGGIYDHLGGGLHRYTVDNQWILPHFEKMLYDNAQLIEVLSKLILIEKNEFLIDKLYETTSFLKNEMMISGGAFFTSLDADSDNEEGKFYIRKRDEILTLLSKEQQDLFFQFYDLIEINELKYKGVIVQKKIPDYRDGNSITHLNEIRKKLLGYRKKKVPPIRDNKILTDLNSLLLTSFCFAYRSTKDESFLDLAREIKRFIEEKLFLDGKLFHSYIESEARVHGYAEDYFMFINALMNLYKLTFDEELLLKAYELSKSAINLFYDETNVVIYQQQNNNLPNRTVDVNDYSTPSSTSTAIEILIKIGRLFDDSEMIEMGSKLLKRYTSNFSNNPFGSGKLLSNALLQLIPSTEYILVEGSDNLELPNFKDFIYKSYRPEEIIFFKSKNSKLDFPFLKDKIPVTDRLTLYVCKDFSCKSPIITSDQLKNLD